MPVKNVDTILYAKWVITVDPENSIHENHAIVLENGLIIDVLDENSARKKYNGFEEFYLSDHAVIPGLINAHTHAAMTLFRGLADDLPLMEWLNDHVWPAEQKWVDAGFVEDGSRLAIAEMLRGGTTTFSDMYFFPEQTAETAVEIGIRAVIGMIMIDFPSAWARDTQEYLDKGIQLHDRYKHTPLIETAFAPHAPYTVSDQPLQKIMTLAETMDVQIHMHIHETDEEINQGIEQFGQRPWARLETLGMLGPRLIAVHMTQLEESEIYEAAKYAVNIVHCPESNLKLASGFCPVTDLQKAGANVALGTDGAASNNDLNMFGEMRTAALLSKGITNDPTASSACEVLRMATINGAKTLSIDHKTGSIESGKEADLVAIDLGRIETQPVYDPVAQIIYSADRTQVSDVWVAGKQLMKNRELLSLDEKYVLQKSADWRERIADRSSN